MAKSEEWFGISYVDSTVLRVCRNRQISKHKVFKGLAERGKISIDWFFRGCKSATTAGA
jgi:Transposase DDE domain